MRIKSRIARPRLAIAAIAAVLALAGTALAISPTPGPLHRAVLSQDARVHSDGIVLVTHGADIATQDITYPPGATSGWHIHPGAVLVVVDSGVFTFHEGCTVRSIGPGQALVETGTTPGLAENVGGVDTVIHATFIAPTGAALRTDVPAPSC